MNNPHHKPPQNQQSKAKDMGATMPRGFVRRIDRLNNALSDTHKTQRWHDLIRIVKNKKGIRFLPVVLIDREIAYFEGVLDRL